MSQEPPAPPVASEADWVNLNTELPVLLDRLLTADAFGGANPPTSKDRGVYLICDGDRPVYVGRTSVTARSRKGSKPPGTSFSKRWEQHTGASSAPNQASLAMKIAREVAEQFEVASPEDLKREGKIKQVAGWWLLRDEDPPPDFYLVFQAAKQFVREELVFTSVTIEDDERGVRSHVFEVYADVVLQSEYGDFSTS